LYEIDLKMTFQEKSFFAILKCVGHRKTLKYTGNTFIMLKLKIILIQEHSE